MGILNKAKTKTHFSSWSKRSAAKSKKLRDQTRKIGIEQSNYKKSWSRLKIKYKKCELKAISRTVRSIEKKEK
jgi:hypothetical protein